MTQLTLLLAELGLSEFEIYCTVVVVSGLATVIPAFCIAYAFLQQFATKAELKRLDAEHKDRNAELKEEQNRLEDRLTRTILDNRHSNERSAGEHAAKLDALNMTMQLFANDTNRVVGALEGKTELMQTLTQKSLNEHAH